MVKKITQSTNVGLFATTVSKMNIKNSEEVTTSAPIAPVAKYSSSHLKANFLTHKGASNVSFGARGDFNPKPTLYLSGGEDDGAEQIAKNISSLPASKLYKGHYYDELVNDVAILIGPNKNAVLTQEEGVSTDIMVHNFTRNMLDAKYVHEGLNPSNTDVVMFDASETLGRPSYEVLLQSVSKNPERKKVVFIENFQQFLFEFQGNPKIVLKEGHFKNTQIVGIMPKPIYAAILKGEVRGLSPDSIKHLGKIDFDGMNAADTKDLLKTNSKYTNNVLKRYKDVDLSVSPTTIDALVDKSAATINGAFPAKAIKILDLAAAAKATELTSHTPGTVVPITPSDISEFFENHTDILSALKNEQGQFKLAENIKTRMSDVGGISTIKEEIKDDILDYLNDPKKFVASGRTVPVGKLLTGPPGNGKTLLARAIAGETGIPFIAASGSEFVEKYVGVGAQRMRELFANARKAAASSEKKMAIIFIDEIDTFAKIRGRDSGGGSSEAEGTLNQLLTEMDGFDKASKTKIFVLAATNRKDMIDSALLRPGRFDGGIEVTAPRTHADRLEILNIHAKKMQFASEAEKVKILDGAAKMTEGMSGADLAGVMQRAARVISKRPDNQVMTYNDMVEGYLQAIAGPVKKSEMPAKDIAMVVRHEGGHAVVLDSLKHDKVSFITLDGRGEFLGAVFHGENKSMPNFKSVVYSAATSYAGGHAEPGFESAGHGAGVSGDLQNATGIIEKAIKKWGLGVHTPQISIGDEASKQGDNLLNMYEQEIKKDINLFSKTAQTISKKLVEFHKGFLDGYVKKFEENAGKGGNNLSGEEFTKMREEWVSKTGKTKQFKALQKEIEKIVSKAQSSNLSFLKKFLKFMR